MTPDPDLRRDTPLARLLKQQIAESGPISIATYMHTCLQHPEFGYYQVQSAIGSDADFITAPEISQIFGELLGLWCATVWQQMGKPQSIQLIELGGGRGTLLNDALRACRLVPDFLSALSVVIVESNAALRDQQAQTLAAHNTIEINWSDDLAIDREQATLVLANEFLDCLPIEQWVATATSPVDWSQRAVGLDTNRELSFTTSKRASAAAPVDPVATTRGDILETRNFSDAAGKGLKQLIASNAETPPLAGLFIDYGYNHTQCGDTLQAVRAHKPEHPLTSPGQADLTAYVDFADFARALRPLGLDVDGPVPQGVFLGRLGAVERASQLMSANPNLSTEIETALARLLSPSGMGQRFQVIGLRSRGMAPLPGLGPLDSRQPAT
jgi:NADH dehydrogenase [ubiquinone] 1 alpha subcomplex assembly factor 7